MQLSNIKRTSVGKNILIDDEVVVIFIPSSSRKIWNGVYETPFLMGNCRGIVVPNKIEKINKKPVNGRIHYLDAKKNFLELKGVVKKLPVLGSLTSIPKKDKEEHKKTREFYFYDATNIMQGLEYWISKLPEKKIYTMLIDNIRTLYNKIKEELLSKSRLWV